MIHFNRPYMTGRETILPNCDRSADTLVRLPLSFGLKPDRDAVFAAAKAALENV